MTYTATPLDAARAAALRDLEFTVGAADLELDALVALAARACGAGASAISVLDGSSFAQIAVCDAVLRCDPGKGRTGRIPAKTAFAMRAMTTGKILIVPDARADPDWANSAQVVNSPFLRSYVGVPVGPAADLPLGVLSIIHTDPNAFGPREIELLELIAETVRLHLKSRLAAMHALRAGQRIEAERNRQMRFQQIF